MAKILIATDKPFAPVAVQGIRGIVEKEGFELVLLEKYTEKAQLLDAVKNVDAIIIRSDIIDQEVLNAAKQLKIVVRAGAGYDNVDLDAATANNVCVMNTPGQNANAVAELVFGMLLYGIRGFFNGTAGIELKDKKLGILAYGHVGRNVARVGKGFGMDQYAYDAYASTVTIENDGVKALTSVEDLFKTCQIVSLHIPATAETKKSINFELMNSMPKGAIVVNTARKEVVDDEGLLKMFAERSDFKYFTDIQPGNHAELLAAYPDRYFATPKKMGAQTAEANINAGLAAANQIVDFLKNGNEQYKVNK